MGHLRDTPIGRALIGMALGVLILVANEAGLFGGSGAAALRWCEALGRPSSSATPLVVVVRPSAGAGRDTQSIETRRAALRNILASGAACVGFDRDYILAESRRAVDPELLQLARNPRCVVAGTGTNTEALADQVAPAQAAVMERLSLGADRVRAIAAPNASPVPTGFIEAMARGTARGLQPGRRQRTIATGVDRLGTGRGLLIDYSLPSTRVDDVSLEILAHLPAGDAHRLVGGRAVLLSSAPRETLRGAYPGILTEPLASDPVDTRPAVAWAIATVLGGYGLYEIAPELYASLLIVLGVVLVFVMGDRELRGKALVASVSVAAAAAVSVGIAAWLRIYIPPWPTVTLVLALFITSVCLELAEAGASIARDERSRTGRDPWSGRSAPQHRDHQVEAAVESVMRWIDVPAAAVHIPELAAGKGTAMATAGAPAEWTSAPELAALADEAIASGLAALGHWPDAGDLHALAVPVAVDGGSPAAIVLAGDSLPFRGNDLKLAAGMLGQLLDERSPAPGGHWTVRDAAGHPGKLPLARQIEWLRAARLGRRREAALHAAWQSGSDGAVIACDSAGRPVRWNRRAERLVDVWELDLHDCHIVPLLAEMSGRDESEIRRAAADTLVSGEPFTFEIEDPVGRHNYVATLSPIPVDEGSIGGLVVRCVDITGVCRPARVEAQLMSVAAHEMRTPLTSVLGFSELIMNAAGDDSPIHERAETIHRQASRLESIVSELATVTRLQAGREELDVDLMDMSGVVRHIVESAQPMAAEHGVTVSATGVDTGYIIHGDTARLERVIENLVSNAIKYSPRGAEATVTVRRSRDRVIVDVTDTGYGIPTEDAPHVFEKFYRAKTDQTKGVQGTGLGLAIVKLIVEAHQGEVSLTTIEGEGSTFSISLPISGPPVPKITAQDIESAVKSRIPHETTH